MNIKTCMAFVLAAVLCLGHAPAAWAAQAGEQAGVSAGFSDNSAVSDAVYGSNKAPKAKKPRLPKGGFTPGKYIIKLKQTENVDAYLAKKTGRAKAKSKASRVLSMQLNANEYNLLADDESIDYIEPDVSANVASTGIIMKEHEAIERIAEQAEEETPWGIKAIGADLAVQQQIAGQGIRIAVLDTGISAHPDLRIAGGVSFVEGISGYADDNGHGTHVAGTIGALGNGQGIIGSAPQADLFAVKVFDETGSGSYSDIIQGIDWAIEQNMNVISMSFGGTQYSEALHEAVQRAQAHGILLIAAAGNQGDGTETELYPAQFPEVVSVGSVTRAYTKSDFSSTGSQLDLVAPGTHILSTTHDGGYGLLSGTSMAVTHVAGAAAALWSQHAEWSAEQVRQALYDTATPLGEQSLYGKGLVNEARALGLVNAPIPTDIQIRDEAFPWQQISLPAGGGGDAGILAYSSGQAPSVNGTSYIMQSKNIQVQAKLTKTLTKMYIGVFNSSGTKIVDIVREHNPSSMDLSANKYVNYTWSTTGSTSKGDYTIKFAYCDASGCPFSDIWSVYVVGYMAPPGNLKADSISPTSIRFSWNDMSSAEVFKPVLNGTAASSYSSSLYKEYTGLSPNTSYTFSVAGYKLVGVEGDYSTITVKTLGNLAAPTNFKATDIRMNAVSLSWNSSGPGLSYEVYRGSTLIGTTLGTSYTVTGLTSASSYSFTVYAKDSLGNKSPASSSLPVKTDHGDTASSAFALSLEEAAAINYAGDADYFAFTPSASGIYTFESSGSTDVKAELYQGASRYMDKNDDFDNTTFNFRISYSLIQGTTYYIKVMGYEGVTGSYSIRATSTSADDYGNDAASSSVLTGSKSGAINYGGDIDVFAFTAPGSGTYKFETSGTTDTFGVLLRNGVEIARHDDIDNPANRNFRIIAALSGGQTYYLQIRHYSKSGTGAYTVQASGTADTEAPTMPVQVRATAVSSNEIVVSWDASNDNSQSIAYTIYRNGVEIGTTPYVTYSDRSLSSSTTHSYTVKAVDGSNNQSNMSASVSATTWTPPDAIPPTTPTGLTVSAVTMTQAALSWTASTDNIGVAGYSIYRNGVLIGSTAGATSYLATGLNASTVYSFTVAARDAAGNLSPVSSSVSITTPDTAAPSAPSGLNAPSKTETSIMLAWTASSDNVGVTGYNVYMGASLIGSTSGAASFTVTGLTIGTTYSFTVRATDAAGNISAPSAALSVTTPDLQPPTAPASTSVGYSSYNQIVILFTPSTDNVGVASYYIYQGTQQIGTYSPSSPSSMYSYTITGLLPSTPYSFTVKARDAAGNLSAASPAVNKATVPMPPQKISATVGNPGQVIVFFAAPTISAGITEYQIFKGSTLAGTFQPTAPSSMYAYTITSGLVSGTTYTFMVKSKDSAGNVSQSSTMVSLKFP